VVVDTNLFLHYKRVDQVDWSGAGADRVVLVVLPAALRELEKVKVSGVPKVRERAAKAVTWLAEQLHTGDLVELKPGLALRFESREPAIDYTANHLDRQVQDDQVLAGVLGLAGGSNEPPAIATADLGLMLKARSRRIPVISPKDADKLAEEADPRDQELRSLRLENAQLKNRLPRLTVKSVNGESHAIVTRPPAPKPPLSLFHLKQKHPYSTAPKPPSYGNVGATVSVSVLSGGISEQLRKRHNEELDAFYRRYEDYLAVWEDWAKLARCRLILPIALFNDGTAPATDIDVAMKFPTGITPLAADEQPQPPSAPKAPEKSALESLASRMTVPEIYLPPRTFLRDVEVPSWSLSIDGDLAHFHVHRLKHLMNEEVPGLMVQFADESAVRSFTIELQVSAAESPTASFSAFNVKIG